MKNEDFSSASALSDDTLSTVVGGVTANATEFTEAKYTPIKYQLTSAANVDDFDDFSAIVCRNYSIYGSPFLARVLDDFTKSGFLSAQRYSLLVANVVAST